MAFFATLGFAAPWILLGLLVLPVLWIILRAIPPAPIRRIFPAVVLLLGLLDKSHASDRTPWWLLLLRSFALASVIIGMAGPILNRQENVQTGRDLLILLDGSWASGRDWSQKIEQIENELKDAERASRNVAFMLLTAPSTLEFRPVNMLKGRMASLKPRAHDPDWSQATAVLQAVISKKFDTIWFSDGLAHGDQKSRFLSDLQDRGEVSVYNSQAPLFTLSGVSLLEDSFAVDVHRLSDVGQADFTLLAEGVDPAGNPAVIARLEQAFKAGKNDVRVEISLPPELRNRITRFSIEAQRYAGARFILANELRRVEAAIFAGSGDSEVTELLKSSHYAKRALGQNADILSGQMADILLANPDMILLADVVTVEAAEDVEAWVKGGGTLLRFAGPRLAGAKRDIFLRDPLMPVALRQGGRRLDGAMSWGLPKEVAPFEEDSPFAGLEIPPDLRVYAQVLAQPGPELSGKVIASLQDGTPLVTRTQLGLGQIVLVHVTANAEWSNLPLTGLFPKLLQRLASRDNLSVDIQDLAGQTWTPIKTLDGFGLLSASQSLVGVKGSVLKEGKFNAKMPPGIYQSDARVISRNLALNSDALEAMEWPGDVVLKQSSIAENDLAGFFLSLAVLAMVIDILASLSISGRLRTSAALCLAILFVHPALPVGAESNFSPEIALTQEVVLGHILSGDKAVDQIANEGLYGLSKVIGERTSVEPGQPVGIFLESDELAFFPLIYWPVSASQPLPSQQAYEKLNIYLKTGGVILFDTRDGDLAGARGQGQVNRALQKLTQSLDIPRLETVPDDHVLTRSFYLLQDFPGRYRGSQLWVQASKMQSGTSEELPFRMLNDGVTPVLIGGNDWASAWALDDAGVANYPVGRGYAGERQREMAFRFGVNLIMHVLTGNYKSDQVHVPALLERLGQ